MRSILGPIRQIVSPIRQSFGPLGAFLTHSAIVWAIWSICWPIRPIWGPLAPFGSFFCCLYLFLYCLIFNSFPLFLISKLYFSRTSVSSGSKILSVCSSFSSHPAFSSSPPLYCREPPPFVGRLFRIALLLCLYKSNIQHWDTNSIFLLFCHQNNWSTFNFDVVERSLHQISSRIVWDRSRPLQSSIWMSFLTDSEHSPSHFKHTLKKRVKPNKKTTTKRKRKK